MKLLRLALPVATALALVAAPRVHAQEEDDRAEAAALLDAARGLAERGSYADARRRLARANNLDPSNTEAALLLGRIDWETGRYDDVVTTLTPVADPRARRRVAEVALVQGRDEDARTGYAIYDSDTGRVEIRRLAYDIDREAHSIRAAGLPQMLADRLYLGV